MSDRFGNIQIESSPTTSPKQSPQKDVRKRPVQKSRKPTAKFTRKSLILAGLISVIICITGGYLALGYWGVPSYIKNTLLGQLENHSGMHIDLNEVQFDPISLELNLNGLAVHEDGKNTRAALSFSTLTTKLAPLQLLRKQFVATNLDIDSLELHLIRDNNGRYNLAQLLHGKDHKADGSPFDLRSLPFMFSLNNISVTNSRVIFEDTPKSSYHLIEQVNLQLPNISNFDFTTAGYIQPSFKAVINGSPIALTGQTTSQDLQGKNQIQTRLTCDFNEIDLPLYFEYLPFHLPMEITRGKAQGSLELTFSPAADSLKISVDYSIQTEDTLLTGAGNSFRLEIPSAILEGSLQPVTGDMHIKDASIRSPTLHISRKFTIAETIGAVFTEPDGGGSKAEAHRQKLSIDRLLIDAGGMVVDESAPGLGKWKAIQLSLQDYANFSKSGSGNGKTQFRLTAEQHAGGAMLSWQGSIDSSGLPAGDLQVENLSANQAFHLLGLEGIHADKGTSELKMHLGFQQKTSGKLSLEPVIAEGLFNFSNLLLTEGKKPWYSAPSTKITGFAKSGKNVSFGSVYLRNSTVTLTASALPEFFKQFTREDSGYGLDALEFSGLVTLKDQSPSVPDLVMTNASLQAINLGLRKPQAGRENITFKANLRTGGQIHARGTVALQPFSGNLKASFTDLQAGPMLSWLGRSDLIQHLDSTISGSGDLSYPDLTFAGKLSLAAGRLVEEEKSYFSWKGIDFSNFRYSHSPRTIAATTCSIKQPELNWDYNHGDKHVAVVLGSYLQHYIAAPLLQSTRKSQPSSFVIDKVSLHNGQVIFTDHRLSPAWRGEVTHLTGQLDKVSVSGKPQPVSLSFSGQLDSIPFTLSGQLDFFSSTPSGKTVLKIEDYPLPSFHEQISNHLDIDTGRGAISATVETLLAKDNVHQKAGLKFSEIFPHSDTADSALTLALITGDENNLSLQVSDQFMPGSSASPILEEALLDFRRLMVKAAVSPLLLATGDFGDLVNNEFAEFLPGQIILSDKGRETISRFNALLSAHPALGLVITGFADDGADAEVMKKALEELETKRVTEENRRRSRALEQETEEYYRKAEEDRKAAGETGQIFEIELPLHLYSKYAPIEPEPVAVDDDMLIQLARQRAEVIADFFIENLALEPERITVSEQSQITDGDFLPGNRVQFTVSTFAPNDAPFETENQAEDQTEGF